MELHRLIKDSEFKLESLPEKYFINYFEEDFLPKLKKISEQIIDDESTIKNLQKIIQNIFKKCEDLADNYQTACFQEELKKIINGKTN